MKSIIERVASICALIAILIVVSGCSASTTSGSVTTETVTDLSKKINDQTKIVDDLTKSVNKLETQVETMRLVEETKGRALDLSGNDGFMKIETDIAMFLVSVTQVEPYLDGVQVTLSIGNPMNATFNGLKMKIEYGTHNALDFSPSGTEKYTQWKTTLKEKTIDLNTEIKPGTWNTAKFTIPAISPKDFGYLYVELTTDSVRLLQP